VITTISPEIASKHSDHSILLYLLNMVITSYLRMVDEFLYRKHCKYYLPLQLPTFFLLAKYTKEKTAMF